MNKRSLAFLLAALAVLAASLLLAGPSLPSLLAGPTPTPANPAPDFALPRENGQTLRLSEYRGRSAVVLIFYQGQT